MMSDSEEIYLYQEISRLLASNASDSSIVEYLFSKKIPVEDAVSIVSGVFDIDFITAIELLKKSECWKTIIQELEHRIQNAAQIFDELGI